jgi:hypothetical protein
MAVVAGLAMAFIVAAQAPAPVQLRVAGRASAHVRLEARGARVEATWSASAPGRPADTLRAVSADGGRTFDAAARADAFLGTPEDGAAIALDSEGGRHQVWVEVVEEPIPYHALYYAVTRDGVTFTGQTRVTPARRDVAHPAISVGPAGEVVVAWDEEAGGRRRVFVSRKDLAGGFGAPQSISEGTAASHPAAVYADGAFVIAWTEGPADDSHIIVRRLPVR